ncbi:MAG TPA: thiamine pyrophosphate-dependent dehydrogenase E1 component subunit alpha [Microthrixaceae bacterium]|nr:thiamine pyrophosphate-dependent dehydrogenase E1 component subunit alpha [Microthrixaceae bacterium]
MTYLVTISDAELFELAGADLRVDALARTAELRLLGSPAETVDERRYRQMFGIRRFEQTLLDLFDEGLLSGTTHCCIGQEADAVGVIEHLRPDDHVFSNHRCHGHYLARTGDARGLLAEIMGRADGVCAGVGGSQHLSTPGFTSNGVLGGTVANAAGIAMAAQLAHSDAISVVFVGDGALGEGIVYETLNLAGLWQLPLLVVCENNGWAQSTPQRDNLSGSIEDRFQAFGFPVRSVATTDVRVVADIAGQEVAATRGAGPRALVIETYRLCHHSKNDDNRPEEEVAARWEQEPLSVHEGRVGGPARSRIEQEVELAIAELVTEFREDGS